MALTDDQINWLTAVSGLEIAKAGSDKVRQQKDVLAAQRTVKLGPVKEGIKEKFASASLKTGVFSKMKVLDEEGGQQKEFDYSDIKDKRQFEQEYLATMQEAMDQLSAVMAEMRDARTPVLDEKTGEPVMKGDEPLMKPLYTEEQIAEEVYMPLVRERLMPEWLVPDKWSKTQQMIDESDKLYKDRLRKHTAEMEEEDQSLLEAGKDATTRLGGLAQKVCAMVPGGQAELAGTVIGLATLGTTTAITGAQMLTKGKLDGSMNEVIGNVSKILGQSLTLATGSKDLGNFASNVFSAAGTGAMMATALAKKPPDAAAAVDALANGVGNALDAAFNETVGTGQPTVAGKASAMAAKQALRAIATGIRMREHVLNGDADAMIAELSSAAKETMKNIQGVVTASMTEGKDKDAAAKISKQQEELTAKIEKGIDLGAAGISTGKKIVDVVRSRKLEGAAEDIVAGIGDVLIGTLELAAPDVAEEIGGTYTMCTKTALVAYYLTQDPPDTRSAIASLGEGFEIVFSRAGGDSSPELEKIGKTIAKAFVSAANGIDLVTALAAGKYGDATKSLTKLARSILSQALQVDSSVDPQAIAEGEQGTELIAGVEIDEDALGEIQEVVATALKGLKDDKSKERLRKQLDDLRTTEALAEIEEAKEEVERALIQGDEGGENAADTRSIEILIKEMKRDRLIMEMATKLMSAGATVIEQFVAPMAIGGAAIKLAANLIKASQRAMALNTWVGNQKDMHKAVSSFESSAANFVKNQAEQFSHYAIQAALELARMIGEIVSCTGISSAAGVALAKGSALAIAAEDIAYEFYKKADLENAWRVTRKAWANPESRKLALMARQLNPTLAKYTLAWGASVKRDALAQEAVRSCGLNALTLSHKDSNVSEVQRYMEVCFSEDNIVLKRFVEHDWMPADVELTARSFMVAKSRGESLGGVEPAEVPGIEETLLELVRLRETFDATVTQIEHGILKAHLDGVFENQLLREQHAYAGAEQRFRTQLGKYQPMNKSGKVHEEMTDLKGMFRMRAEESTAEIDQEVDRLMKLRAKAAAKEEARQLKSLAQSEKAKAENAKKKKKTDDEVEPETA